MLNEAPGAEARGGCSPECHGRVRGGRRLPAGSPPRTRRLPVGLGRGRPASLRFLLEDPELGRERGVVHLVRPERRRSLRALLLLCRHRAAGTSARARTLDAQERVEVDARQELDGGSGPF